MSRLTAALADRYRIERELGQGGMATVYLAEDLKHDRKVALKVLKPELAAVLGAERFVVEIKTTAALQHPHILPLFDSGTADGFLFYVMPFIDGETLRDKLNRETQLGVDEAVRIATEVADALDYAHRHGVIHRDIKPENILLHDGRPMVADFGIALAVSAAAGGRMTETGLSLGTPYYMSPEQATADKQITARSDIYSLASVLYEMLAGEPPHMGNSAQQIIMKIVTDAPKPVDELRRSTPPQVAAAVMQALQKLPADRFATAADFVAALKAQGGATRTVSGRASAPRTRLSRERALAAALLLAILAAALGWTRRTPVSPPSRQQVVLWKYQLPDALIPGTPLIATQAAIAPDGSSIVFTDSTSGGLVLMRKPREAVQAEPIAGTEGGVSPFFSPDGQWIGFLTTDGKVRKVPVTGGGVITLATDVNVDYKVGVWADDGRIYYTTVGSKLARLDADNPQRPSVVVSQLGGATAIALGPLPGSRGLLVTVCPGNCAVESRVTVLDFATDSLRQLVPGAYGAWYAPTGHLLYTAREGGLFAMAFDARRLETTSGAVPVMSDVAPGSFVLSASGDALYSVERGQLDGSELVWTDRAGRATPFDSTWRAPFEYPALSPDGRTLAVSVRGETTDLWLRRPNGARQKVIAPGSANWRPSWTADGSALYFSSVGGSRDPNDVTIRKVRADLSAAPQLVQGGEFGTWEVEVSRDEKWLVIRRDEGEGNSNIRYRAVEGDTALKPLVVEPGQSTTVALSPDGRWLAFSSDDGSGARYDLFVAPFPSMSPRRLVSREGGTEPRWARNGRELFFKSGGRMMAVSVADGPALDVSDPAPLFSLAGYRGARNRQQYDVGPDGRFLMIRDPRPGEAAPVVYAAGWLAELRGAVR
jgi:Tol biopolymer transport system component/tRNA A-37 threonylcarbamoyl transferase component Bud32